MPADAHLLFFVEETVLAENPRNMPGAAHRLFIARSALGHAVVHARFPFCKTHVDQMRGEKVQEYNSPMAQSQKLLCCQFRGRKVIGVNAV